MASETAVLLSLTVQCSLSRMRGDGIVSHLRNGRARFGALAGGQCGEYLPHLLAQIMAALLIKGGATTRNGSDERANSGHWYELVALAMPEVDWEVTDSVRAESPAMGAETHIPGMAPRAAPERLQRFLVDRGRQRPWRHLSCSFSLRPHCCYWTGAAWMPSVGPPPMLIIPLIGTLLLAAAAGTV